jgi:16S rRNA (guanine966-N2)-methyltransferase
VKVVGGWWLGTAPEPSTIHSVNHRDHEAFSNHQPPTTHHPVPRIIAGALKGRNLITPPGLDTRPLLDRIKQSLFDWLGQDMTGWRVADVCAGSGSFGCEAFSRGASEVHCIEAGRHAWPALLANRRSCGDPAALHVHQRLFQQVLPTLKDLDLVFADPPFPWFSEDRAALEELLRLAAAALRPQGLLVVRGERGQDLPTAPRGLGPAEKRLYGRSWIVALPRLATLPDLT